MFTTISSRKSANRLFVWGLVIPIMAVTLLILLLRPFRLTAVAATRYIATSGSDAGPNDCLTPANPCQTIGYAATVADPDDMLLIAQGTYLENVVLDRLLTLAGGYEATHWTRDLSQYETIIDGSGSPTIPGDWDGQQVLKVSVLNNNGVYMLWYDGHSLANDTAVGLATSPDGITWIKHPQNPVLTANPNTWEHTGEEFAPFVLLENGVYKMWYERSNGQTRNLGYATSPDGVTWSKDPNNPVLSAGPEPYDEQTAGHGTVLNDGGMYKLWYHAVGDQGAIIAYATSADGLTWTKQGPALLPDSASWDDGGLWGPSVLKLNGVYWMWYAAYGSGHQPAIGVATSPDGLTWTRPFTQPILADATPIGDPHVISDSGALKMWYTDFDQGVVKYAESDDGFAWLPYPDNPVLTPGVAGQWGGPVVELAGGGGSVLDGLTITGGSDGFGGGVQAHGEDITIRRSLIYGNYASGQPSSQGAGGVLGGIGGGTVIIENSRILNNDVGEGAGGVRVHVGALIMTNTLVAGNTGDAGIHVNGPLSLMHVTVAHNDGGVNFNPPTNEPLVMANSIVYDNGWSLGAGPNGTMDIRYSDVEDGVAGVGNIDAPPAFVNPAADDYHLLGSSPVVDAGTPAGAPPTDLDGVVRDAAPDMGAYELARFDADTAVTNILPAGDLAVGIAVPIRVTLYNVGLQTQTAVPVTCDITNNSGPIYMQTATSGPLAPLTWQVIAFPAFTPPTAGDYTLTCQSNLPGDQNPGNDTQGRMVTAVAELADVWVRDNLSDNGDVPSNLTNWYESPDLWIRNNADGGLTHQDPIAGMENTVYVRLRNRGTTPVTGSVDVYWIEPSLGVRCGDWAYIDTIAFADLLPGETRILNTAWTPSRTGHTCLQSVVDSAADPYNRGMACAPLWVPWDNNVGWHNVNILANPTVPLAGVTDVQQGEAQLVNVYNLPQDVDLVIERRTFPLTGTITVQLPGDLFERWQSAGGAGSGIEVMTATQEIQITGVVSGTIAAIPLAAAERATVGMSFAGPAGLTFELSVLEQIGGATVGGVTYQWTIPDTTPPTVSGVTPEDTAVDVTHNAPITITFDEPVSPLNFSLSLTPDPGGWVYYWNDASTQVTAVHAPLAAEQFYHLSVTASDAANNPMAAPFDWSFTTGSHYLYLPMLVR